MPKSITLETKKKAIKCLRMTLTPKYSEDVMEKLYDGKYRKSNFNRTIRKNLKFVLSERRIEAPYFKRGKYGRAKRALKEFKEKYEKFEKTNNPEILKGLNLERYNYFKKNIATTKIGKKNIIVIDKEKLFNLWLQKQKGILSAYFENVNNINEMRKNEYFLTHLMVYFVNSISASNPDINIQKRTEEILGDDYIDSLLGSHEMETIILKERKDKRDEEHGKFIVFLEEYLHFLKNNNRLIRKNRYEAFENSIPDSKRLFSKQQ